MRSYSALGTFCLVWFFIPAVHAQPIEEATGVKYFSGATGNQSAGSKNAVMRSAEFPLLDESRERRAYELNEEGVELVFQGKRTEGRKKIQQALDYDPKNPTVLYNLAGLSLAESRPKDAIALMERAVELRPNDLAFLNRLAESHFADSNIVRALEYYEKIVASDPGYAEALLRLGTLYGMAKRWDKAEETLSRAVKLHPKDTRALSNYGNILVLREKFDAAIEVLTRAQALKPTAENAVALGIAHETAGKKEAALRDYQSAKALGDKDPELDKHLAELDGVVTPSATAQTTDTRPQE